LYGPIAAGGGFKDVIKTTVLMKDINKFSEVNGIYGKFFTSHQPARAAFQVAALPKAGNVEIEAVAVIGAVNVGSILINGML
jgi:enamine deaminase RidA (YjgF/YER057c/UK114 family)